MKKALLSVFLLLVFSSFAHSELNIELLGELYGENDGDRFGHCVANLGDINGDGFEDFAVGAPYYPEWTDTGRVYIYLGSENFDLNPDLILENPGEVKWFGWSICGLKDVNDDGCDEFLVDAWGYRVFLYFGGDPPDVLPDRIYREPAYGYGSTLASGDVNNDGLSDFVARGEDTVYVYLGSEEMDTIPDFRLCGSQLGMEGVAVGDVNGDGYQDVVAACYVEPNTRFTYLYFGRDSLHSEPDVIFPVGLWKSGVGDVNADGFDDIIAYYHLYFGSEQPDTSNYLILPKARDASEVGRMNRDGYGDIVTGYHWYFFDDQIFIYLGGAQPDSIYDWGSPARTDNFGYDMAVVDVNADNVDEFLVSQTYYPNDLRRGRVFVYSGDTTTTSVPSPFEALPSEVFLSPNYPNPFNSKTVIEFSIASQFPVSSSLKIYNTRGRLVKTLLEMAMIPGRYHYVWDGTDELGEVVSSGVYFILLDTGDTQQTRKALLIK